jgi:hypothetical protein
MEKCDLEMAQDNLERKSPPNDNDNYKKLIEKMKSRAR